MLHLDKVNIDNPLKIKFLKGHPEFPISFVQNGLIEQSHKISQKINTFKFREDSCKDFWALLKLN